MTLFLLAVYFCFGLNALEIPISYTIQHKKSHVVIDTLRSEFTTTVERLKPAMQGFKENLPYNNFAQTCYSAACELLQQTDEQKIKKAVMLLHACAAQNNPDSLYLLSLMYSNGSFVKKDAKKAQIYAEKAKQSSQESAILDFSLKLIRQGKNNKNNIARELIKNILVAHKQEHDWHARADKFTLLPEYDRMFEAVNVDGYAGQETKKSIRQRMIKKIPVYVDTTVKKKYGTGYFWFRHLGGSITELESCSWYEHYTKAVALYTDGKFHNACIELAPLVQENFIPAVFMYGLLLCEHGKNASETRRGITYVTQAAYENYPPALCYGKIANLFSPFESLVIEAKLQECARNNYLLAYLVLAIDKLFESELSPCTLEWFYKEACDESDGDDTDVLIFVIKYLSMAKKEKLVAAYKQVLQTYYHYVSEEKKEILINGVLERLLLLEKAGCLQASIEILRICKHKLYGQSTIPANSVALEAICEYVKKNPHDIRLDLKNAGLTDSIRRMLFNELKLVKSSQPEQNNLHEAAMTNYAEIVLAELLPTELAQAIESRLRELHKKKASLKEEEYAFVVWCTHCISRVIPEIAKNILDKQPKVLVSQLTPEIEQKILDSFEKYSFSSLQWFEWQALHGDYEIALGVARKLSETNQPENLIRAYPHFLFAAKKIEEALSDLGVFLCHYHVFSTDELAGVKILITAFKTTCDVDRLRALILCNKENINKYLRETYQQTHKLAEHDLLLAACVNMSLALYSASACKTDYTNAIEQLKRVIDSQMLAPESPDTYKKMFINVLNALESYSGKIIIKPEAMKNALIISAERKWPKLAEFNKKFISLVKISNDQVKATFGPLVDSLAGSLLGEKAEFYYFE